MKKYYYIIFVMCLLLSLCGCSSDTQKGEISDASESANIVSNNPTNSEISYGFLDYSIFDKYLTNGTYRCGSDFEPGDYYILSLYGAEALYDVSDKPNDFSWSDYRVIRKVSVESGQYVCLSSAAILVSVDEVSKNDWKKYGVFLVGTDLPEGDYKITSLEDTYTTELDNVSGIWGAYQISDSSPENEPEDCCPLFDKQTYISVKNGQYVIINNARMVLAGSETSNEDNLKPKETSDIRQKAETSTYNDKYNILTNSDKKAICEYVQSRYDYYDKINGGYSGDKYSDIIMQEAADKYDITAQQVQIIWNNMYLY